MPQVKPVHKGQLLLSLLGLSLSCAHGFPEPQMPVAVRAVTRGEIDQWVAATEQRLPARIRFKWTYIDKDGAAKGNGAVLLVPPDTLRFDFDGSFSAGRGAAVVVGERPLWVDPQEAFDKLIPSYPILWALVGRAMRAGPAVAKIEVAEDGKLQAWRYLSGADTMEYILRTDGGRSLVADIKHAGERVGKVSTILDTLGFPEKARLEIPSRPAQLELSFYGLDYPHTPDPSDWEKPRDAN